MSLIIQDRRQLHRHPESAFCEIETAAFIYERLRALLDFDAGDQLFVGDAVIDVDAVPGMTETDFASAEARAKANGVPDNLVELFSRGRTGIVADIKGCEPGPTIGLRADIDALGVTESSSMDHVPRGLGFASEFDGIMHACGHDGHIAVALEVAKRLTENRDFPGVFRLIFQPAEEGVRGAMVTKMSATDPVDTMLGMHLGIGMPVGEVAAGAHGLLATENVLVEFTGVQAHAAFAPEQGRNALLAACSTALTLHSLPQRSDGNTRLNVGTLQAGSGSNIIADRAQMLVEYRCDNKSVLANLKDRVEAVIAGNATAYDVDYTITLLGESTTLVCDQTAINRALEAAKTVPGIDKAIESVQFDASDDVSIFIERVQNHGGNGTFLAVGCSSPGPHHSATFDIDERALPIAADWIESIVRLG